MTYNITIDSSMLEKLQSTIGDRDAVGRWLQKQVDALISNKIEEDEEDYYNYEKWDITKTKGYQEAMEDIRCGRVHHAASVDDMMKQILG